MATPFFKIYINGDETKELRGTVDSFDFEDCVDEDSFLTITMGLPEDMDISESPYLENGMLLTFKFGLLQGLYSQAHTVKIVDVEYDYGNIVTLSLKCLDIGTNMKKNSEPKVWKNKTTIEIVKEILEGHGMEFEYDEYKGGHKKWESMPQGKKSDFDFIKYLVSREVSGNYLFYIRGIRGYLVQRSNENQSTGTYTYAKGEGVVLAFKPSIKESSQTGAGNSSSVTTTGADGKTTTSTDDSEPESGNKFLFDKDANDVGNTLRQVANVIGTPEQKKKTKKSVGKNNNPAVADADEAKNLASFNKTKENAKIMTANLRLELDPTIVPNTVINMAGVFKPHQGAWLIKKVRHRIDSSGGTTSCDMEKGFKKNKSKGPKKGGKGEAPKKPITAVDGNGNEVYVNTSAYNRKIIPR